MAFTSYAQNFEDVMLWRALKHVEKGCYVDVGAQHPVIDSVSKAFYERGWRGVHIEPVPEYARLLRQDRPDETVLEVALSDFEGTLELNVIPESGLSTVVDAYAQRHHTEKGFDCQRIQVPVLTLKSALQPLAGKDVHWLKIDVEGLESQVLKGWDSQVSRPWVMVIEATIPNSTETDYANWDPILTAANYQIVYFDGLNRFYVAKEHAELAVAFSTPPNVFDDVILTTGSAICRELVTSHQASERALTAQAEVRVAQAEVHVAQAEVRVAQAEVHVAQAEAHVAQAEAHVAQAKVRVAQAKAHVVQMESQLRDVLNSRSWRITLPLRLAVIELRRIREAIQSGGYSNGLQGLGRSLLQRLGLWVLHQPMLERAALAVLDLMPGVRHHLHHIVRTPASTSGGAAQESGDLSPRAARIYADLRQAIGARKN
jgi:FkbM family methyltransferase